MHIYPSMLQALAGQGYAERLEGEHSEVSGRGYAGCLHGCFQGYRSEAMHYLGYELPRILILRPRVNKGKK